MESHRASLIKAIGILSNDRYNTGYNLFKKERKSRKLSDKSKIRYIDRRELMPSCPSNLPLAPLIASNLAAAGLKTNVDGGTPTSSSSSPPGLFTIFSPGKGAYFAATPAVLSFSLYISIPRERTAAMRNFLRRASYINDEENRIFVEGPISPFSSLSLLLHHQQ